MKLLNIRHSLASTVILLTVVLALFQPSYPVLAAGTTAVSVSAPTQPVSPGKQFTVNITIQPNNPIAGVQFNLSFNPSLVTVNGIDEGNLLNQNGASTYFMPGTINNTTGTINGVAGAIIGNGQTVSTPGILAVITMTSSATGGTCPFTLSNVIVGDINGQSVPVNMVNGQVVTNGGTTTTPPPPSGGSGGGGGPIGPTTVAGVTNVTSIVNAEGIFSQDINIFNDDNNFLLHIAVGTTGLNSGGASLTQISIIPVTTPPAFQTGAGMVTLTYDFTPSGTTFSQPVTVRFSYDPTLIPAGVAETSLQIAYYDSTTSAWITLPSTVDTASHFIYAQIVHFTPYAVTYGVKAVTPAQTTMTPTPTTTTPPVVTTTLSPPITTTTITGTTTTPTTTSVMPIPTTITMVTTTTSRTTIEPTTTPNSPPPTNTPVVRMAILASVIGVALILIIVTISLILLHRRKLLKKDGRFN